MSAPLSVSCSSSAVATRCTSGQCSAAATAIEPETLTLAIGLPKQLCRLRHDSQLLKVSEPVPSVPGLDNLAAGNAVNCDGLPRDGYAVAGRQMGGGENSNRIISRKQLIDRHLEVRILRLHELAHQRLPSTPPSAHGQPVQMPVQRRRSLLVGARRCRAASTVGEWTRPGARPERISPYRSVAAPAQR